MSNGKGGGGFLRRKFVRWIHRFTARLLWASLSVHDSRKNHSEKKKPSKLVELAALIASSLLLALKRKNKKGNFRMGKNLFSNLQKVSNGISRSPRKLFDPSSREHSERTNIWKNFHLDSCARATRGRVMRWWKTSLVQFENSTFTEPEIIKVAKERRVSELMQWRFD